MGGPCLREGGCCGERVSQSLLTARDSSVNCGYSVYVAACSHSRFGVCDLVCVYV